MTVLIDVVDEDTNRRRAFMSIWILLVGTITDEFRDSKISQQATVFATHLRQRFPMEMEEALTTLVPPGRVEPGSGGPGCWEITDISGAYLRAGSRPMSLDGV
jgi:hypothetical protein